MHKMTIAGSALAGLLLSAGAALAGTPPALYTAAQAGEGAAVFAQDCAMCHGADLKGGAGPALLGQSFASLGANATIGSVFSILSQQMPANRPGGQLKGGRACDDKGGGAPIPDAKNVGVSGHSKPVWLPGCACLVPLARRGLARQSSRSDPCPPSD